jgi:hypothetical protein
VNSSRTMFCQHSLTHCKYIKVPDDTSLDLMGSVPRMESPSTRSWCQAKCRAKGRGGDLILFFLDFYAMATEEKVNLSF